MAHTPFVLTSTQGMDRRTWLQWRRKGIGGSDAPILFGLYPFGRTVWDLWAEKTGRTPIEDEPFNLTTAIGKALEDVLAAHFTQQTGWRTFRDGNMYAHPLYPWMIADLDYLIDFGNGKYGILEEKTTSFFNKDDWADDSIPLNYKIQCAHYMAVMDLDVVYIVCLYDNNPQGFIRRRITRDMAFEKQLIEAEASFWNDYVQNGVEPMYIEPAEIALASLKKHLTSVEKRYEMLLDESVYGVCLHNLQQLELERATQKKNLGEIDKQIAACNLIIRSALADGKSGRCGAFSIRYSSQNRRSCDFERLQVKYPDVYAEVISSNKFETLKITLDKAALPLTKAS